MGQYRGTVLYETTECETLYMCPSWFDDGVVIQSISLATVEKNITSLIISKIYQDFPPKYIHMIFTKEETDELIKALLQIKENWIIYNE